MNLTKTPKRIRNSTEDEEVNIESETSEGSDFVQRRRRLNKKARRAQAKLFSKTPIKKSKETGKSLTETEIAKEKTNEKPKPAPAGRPFRRQGNQPPPTFLQHPVVLEDLGTGVASFLDNGPRTASSVPTNHRAHPIAKPTTIGQVSHRLPIETTARDPPQN